MAYRRRFIGAADLLIDDKTGAILVAGNATGSSIPLAFVDPGSDAYTAAIQPGRACGVLRVIVGNSGVVISLDGGATAGISLPPNCMDEIALTIASYADIKVSRYTACVAMTDLTVEVR